MSKPAQPDLQEPYTRQILENCYHQMLRAAGRKKRDERSTVSLEELGSFLEFAASG